MRFGPIFRKYSQPSLPILLGIAAAAVNLFVIAMVFWSLHSSRNQYRVQAETTARNLCQVLEQNLVGTIEEVDLVLLAVKGEAEREINRGGIQGETLDAFIAQQFGYIRAIDNVRIINAQGEVRYGTYLPPNFRLNLADRGYFRQLRDDPHAPVVISEPLIGRLLGRRALIFARRINGPDNSFAGVVFATVSLEQLSQSLGLVDVGENGAVTLWGSDRTVLARYPMIVGDDFTQLSQLRASRELQGLLDEGRIEGAYTTRSGVDNIERTFAFHKVSGRPFVIGAGLAPTDYLAGWRHEAKRMWALVVLFGLFTIPATAVINFAWKRQLTAQEAVQESARFLRTIIDLVPHPIFVKDRESRYLLVNRVCAETYGTTPEQMVGRHTSEIISDASRAEAFIQADREVLDSGTAQFFAEEEIRQPSGAVRLHKTHKVPFVSSRTGDKALIGVSVDITEYKRTQQALAENEHWLRTIVELAPDGIFVVNEQGQFLEVNAAGCQQLGYTRDQLLQLKIFDVVAPQFAARAAARLRGEVPSGTYENAHIRADGVEVPMELSVAKIMFRGQPAFLRITRDITERKRAEEEKAKLQNQLLQAQKLESVGQLAGGVAHDFNNLLQVINGYSDLLLLKMQPDDPLRRRVTEIRQAGEQGAALTKHLLTFSREQIIEPQPVDLNGVIEESRAMLQRLVGEDIEIETSLSLALGQIMSDPGRLHQVLMNLAANSRDAMPHGGKFTIRTANVDISEVQTAGTLGLTPGRFVLLQVSDTGTGIPKEIQERIFDPFYTTKDRGKGTGLGLATVYGIVGLSGGAISVRSESGHGATFNILLPRIQVTLPDSARASVSPEHAHGNETVLVVEDRAEVRDLVVDALQGTGYQVLEAAEGSAALDVAAQHSGKIHLLLTDVIMPRMSGKELADRLKQLRPEIRVLYMSGYAADVISSRGSLDAGEQYIAKPFSLTSLLTKVREIL
jgi:PAS domain S-box-containing protein